MNFDLTQIRPDAFRAYLSANGWTDTGSDPCAGNVRLMQVWTRGEYEAAVPLRADYRDFRRRLLEAVTTVGKAEKREASEVAADLVNSGFDVVRIRILSQQAHEGVLPLEQAAEYVQRAKDMLLSAACSAAEPKIYYPARKPRLASDYIRRVKFGQTERGSFVFALLSPVAPIIQAEQSDADVGSFERRVTRTLLGGVRSVKEAASQAALTAFEQHRDHGVSANLCAALAGLAGDTEDEHDVELRFSWALVNPADIPTTQELIPRSFAPVIREAARILKARAPREEFVLRGPVIKLEREGDAPGSVVVWTEVDGLPKKVTVELHGESYAQAIAAHQTQTLLVATGNLVKEGKRYRLQAPRNVHTADDADETIGLP
ncbi:hypothetical protein [Azohydromonas aeria]|uniref:hypothetical protein n=1 Tax=Azohydromonas aeria TaxID=2590212 RepID=UPI0012FB0E63|nr:hypothetical protein [Azohydromonas aeria]